jgi:hypothetical protein
MGSYLVKEKEVKKRRFSNFYKLSFLLFEGGFISYDSIRMGKTALFKTN